MSNAKTFCMFIGYKRSGSTISGKLVSLHPKIGLGNGYNPYLASSKEEVIKGIIQTLNFKEEGERKNFDNYEVIGTKSGDKVINYLKEHKNVSINTIRDRMNMEKFKLLHVVRNPFDQITTWHLKSENKYSVKKIIKKYRWMNEMIEDIKIKENVYTFKLEGLIDRTGRTLKDIYKYLEVGSNKTALKRAKGMIYKTPHITRKNIKWNKDRIKEVNNIINRFSFLEGYTWD